MKTAALMLPNQEDTQERIMTECVRCDHNTISVSNTTWMSEITVSAQTKAIFMTLPNVLVEINCFSLILFPQVKYL